MTRDSMEKETDETCGADLMIWLLGAGESRRRLACGVSAGLRCAREFESVADVLSAAETEPPALLLVSLDWPDQFSRSAIEALVSQLSATRLVCVASPWCASMHRTRGAWPAAVVIGEDNLPNRLTIERLIIEGRITPIPMTAGREELVSPATAESERPFERIAPFQIAGRDPFYAQFLRDSLRSFGVSAKTDTDSDRAERFVIDGDPWTLHQQIVLDQTTCDDVVGTTVVLTDDLAPASHPANRSGVAVISKFDPYHEWIRRLMAGFAAWLLVLTSGCSQAVPSPQPATQIREPAWSQQIDAVRQGAAKRIAVSGPVSREEWNSLKSGCEQIEILEVDRAEISDKELAILTMHSKLHRLKLGIPVGDEGAELLSNCKSIVELNLPAAKLTDAGLKMICRLPLRQLRLHGPELTDDGLTSIGGLTGLRFLHLIDVPVTDAALPTIEGLKSLESLYLDGGCCTDEGLHRLLKARPDIHFHRDQMHLPDDAAADRH